MHLNRFGSNLTKKSLKVQKIVAPVQKYNILNYIDFSVFWVIAGKVIKFETK